MTISISLQANQYAHSRADQLFYTARIISYSTKINLHPGWADWAASPRSVSSPASGAPVVQEPRMVEPLTAQLLSPYVSLPSL